MGGWVITVFCISVVFILYLLRRYAGMPEGFENANIDKLSVCPMLEKHIGLHNSRTESLEQDGAVHTLHIHNQFTEAYQKKYDELGCGK
jgi:hypothetical protein